MDLNEEKAHPPRVSVMGLSLGKRSYSFSKYSLQSLPFFATPTDEYYERHVAPRLEGNPGHGPFPSMKQLQRHYHRTHYFAPSYLEQRIPRYPGQQNPVAAKEPSTAYEELERLRKALRKVSIFEKVDSKSSADSTSESTPESTSQSIEGCDTPLSIEEYDERSSPNFLND